jgi:hypothetical protein
MISTKIKIDLAAGIVEAEGSEEFVRSIYDDFKNKIDALDYKHTKSSHASGSMKGSKGIKNKKAPAKTTSGKKRASTTMPSIVKDLNLAGSKTVPRLKDFYNIYRPKTNFDRNLVFIYYLEHKKNISKISIDHIFTCYRNIPSLKAPNALKQSLYDTSFKKGWIDTKVLEDMKITTQGLNYIEHDMPKASDE